jgi:succinate dehydrogenase / fumarate reductase membrane anchor subunit
MPFRTPLSRVRGLGAGHEGTGHFWRQRVTSVLAIPLTLFLIFACLFIAGADYAAARAFLAHPLVAVALLLLVLVYVDHMRIGMEEIVADYVHGPGVKVLSLILNTGFSLAVGAIAVVAILKLAFGA